MSSKQESMDLASIERGLDDEAYGLLNRPSSSMSASRGGAGGESSSRLSRGGVDSVVSTSPSSVNGKVVYIPSVYPSNSYTI